MMCGEITEVLPSDFLFRRVLPDHWIDDMNGGKRVSSGAFKLKSKKPDPECSVTLERIESAEQALSHGLVFQGIARFPASVVFGLSSHQVVHTPKCEAADPEKREPGHCTLFGLTQQTTSTIAAKCVVVIPPKPRLAPDVDD